MLNFVNKVNGVDTADGDGVKIRRMIGTQHLLQFDPFLLLDKFKSEEAVDYIGGFPPHPHKGFETLTYMLYGEFEHRDSTGGHGLLQDGAVQYMHAGKGIIHSETPMQTNGLVWGYQLWINLPASEKMTEPFYQDISAADIPEIAERNLRIRIISGKYKDRELKHPRFYPINYFHIQSLKNDFWQLQLAQKENIIIYIINGNIRLSAIGQEGEAGELLLLHGDNLRIEFLHEATDVLVLSAIPIGEPIYRHGPFVTTSKEEMEETIDDYHNGKFIYGGVFA